MYDVLVIGGGIVGLSVAMHKVLKSPGTRVAVVEKESQWAFHQTAHNSGVIHSGIYYKPGSFKARFCRDGSQSMVRFCQQYDIDHEVCGKVIVAVTDDEIPRLEAIYQRGLANGLGVSLLNPEQVREKEPHVSCKAGIYVPTTGIVNYAQVCQKYADLIEENGGELFLNTKVIGIQDQSDTYRVDTTNGTYEAKQLINCAGLHSDRIAKRSGAQPEAKIVPFRGEYYELTPEKRHLVKGLIYPVPNPDFPFLGVHFTRMIDGTVHAGPNAVLSLKREGYRKTDFDLRDCWDVLSYPGFWKLAAKHADEGFKEIIRSFSKAAFVKSLQRLIPEITADDLVPTHAGVRAQALQQSGKLVDDFLLINDEKTLHVCNAPSPAATSSLEIGKEVVEQMDKMLSKELITQR